MCNDNTKTGYWTQSEHFLSASNLHSLGPQSSISSTSFYVFQVGNSQEISPSQLCLHSLSSLQS